MTSVQNILHLQTLSKLNMTPRNSRVLTRIFSEWAEIFLSELNATHGD